MQIITFDNTINNFKEEIGKPFLLDKEVAYQLGITPANFYSLKFRERIPFMQIIKYCKKNNIDINKIF